MRRSPRGVKSVLPAAALGLALLVSPAGAASFIALHDAVICKYLADLKAVQPLLATGGRTAAEAYFSGEHPACMILPKGEAAELLDRDGGHLQLVTRLGTPRFIGWGEVRSFVRRP